MFIAFWILVAILAIIMIGATAKFIYGIFSITDDMIDDIKNKDSFNDEINNR